MPEFDASGRFYAGEVNFILRPSIKTVNKIDAFNV